MPYARIVKCNHALQQCFVLHAPVAVIVINIISHDILSSLYPLSFQCLSDWGQISIRLTATKVPLDSTFSTWRIFLMMIAGVYKNLSGSKCNLKPSVVCVM